MKSNAKILVAYNEPIKFYNNYIGKEYSNAKEDVDLSERGLLEHLSLIKELLLKEFESVEFIGFNSNIKQIIEKINSYSPNVVLNFVESVEGDANFEIFVAGLYELLGFEHTGNTANCLGNCLNKVRTKQILKSFNISTPGYQLITLNKKVTPKTFSLDFPVILKLNKEDASIGISEFSVIHDFKSLQKRLDYLFKNYKQDVIIEEYIEGRELNIAILGDKILPISEITFTNLPKHLPKIVTYEAKWAAESIYYNNTVPVCPAPNIDEKLKVKIEKLAMDAYLAMECRDYVRVDVRLSKKNIPYVIEVNPNPDISLDSGFVRSAKTAGIEYNELLKIIIGFGLNRRKNDKKIAG